MGNIFPAKPENNTEQDNTQTKLDQYVPLYILKKNLMEELNIDDEHFFKVFVTYRFKNSNRNTDEIAYNIKQLRRKEIGQFYDFSNDPELKAKIDLAIQGETQINDKKKSTNKEGESTPPKGRALDTSHFNSKGVSKEGMDIIFVGPIDGKCPLPPNFPIADLNLLDNQEQNILVATWIGDSRYP